MMRRFRWKSRVSWGLLGLGGCLVTERGFAQSDDPALSPVPPAVFIPEETAAPPPPETPAAELPTVAVVLKLGLVVIGVGKDSASCSGADCGLGTERNLRYQHRPSPHFGGEVLWQPLPWLRTGPSVALSLAGKIEFATDSSTLDYGTMFSGDWVLEFTPRLGKRTWLLPRLQTGYSMLSPTGGLKSNLDAWQMDCENNTAQFDGCSSVGGLHSGVNLGFGFGVLFATNSIVRLRIDTLAELYWLKIASLSAKAAAANIDESNYGARFLLTGGVEF